METLQEIIERLALETLTISLITAAFIKKQLKLKGIVISDDHFDLLRHELKFLEDKNIEDSEKEFNVLEILIKIGVSHRDLENLSNDDILPDDEILLLDFAKDLLSKAVKLSFNTTLEVSLSSGIQHLSENVDDILSIEKEERDRFQVSHKYLWGEALKKFEFFISTVREAARRFHNKKDKGVQNEREVTFNALNRLLARACQISFEILTLLESGFADGAYARWRTLHEIAVTASFISKHGEDTAKRYLHHFVVDSYEAALSHQQYYQRLGYDPIDIEELEDIKTDYERAIQQYGDSFKGLYGWAAKALNIKKPTYKDIEADVELDHLKPYYKFATSNVHATPTGIYSKISLPESGFRSGLLTGYSVLGIEIPGQATAISLYQIAVSCFSISPSADSIHTCNLLNHFKQEAINAFVESEAKIKIKYSSDEE